VKDWGESMCELLTVKRTITRNCTSTLLFGCFNFFYMWLNSNLSRVLLLVVGCLNCNCCRLAVCIVVVILCVFVVLCVYC